MNKIINDRFESLDTELKQEIYSKSQSIKDFRTDLQKNIGTLKEKCKLIDKERESNAQELSGQFSRDATELTNSYKEERKLRVTNNEKLREVLGELVRKSVQEVEQNKKERTENEDAMLELLENVCNKIHNLAQ